MMPLIQTRLGMLQAPEHWNAAASPPKLEKPSMPSTESGEEQADQPRRRMAPSAG